MSSISPVLLKNECARLCRSHTSVRDYAHICVSYLSREPYPAAELIMSCGTYASPTWQAHSEDSSLFTRASMMTFYWMTCSSICSMRTATACFFSPIISRINSLDRLLASWWMRNCFPVHRLILRCVRRWALVALQMNQGEQMCLCVKIKRAPRLDNLIPGKLCLTAKVGWLFADFIILLPPQRKKERWMPPYLFGTKCVDLLKMAGGGTFWTRVKECLCSCSRAPQGTLSSDKLAICTAFLSFILVKAVIQDIFTTEITVSITVTFYFGCC